ncbi:MAG: TetR/AcrR family transcriptional regulator [Ktedonobacterales bacterium]
MPREDLSEERQQQILEAAIRVFAEHGFSDARMEDIAKESGMSKGAVYLYYKSKDAIISALLRAMFTWMMRGFRTTLEGSGTATERLQGMVGMFADEIDRMAVAMPIMLEFYAIAARQSRVRDFFGQVYVEFRDDLSRLIRQGIEDGEFRAVDPDEVALTFLALAEGLTLIWAMNPRGLAWREHANAALRLLLDGLSAP